MQQALGRPPRDFAEFAATAWASPVTAAGSSSRLGESRLGGHRADGDRADGDRADGNRADGNRTDGKGTAMGWAGGTLVAATVTAGLMAGLFAAFSYAIMPGLGKASDLAFVDGMQRINVAILNGWFGICFGGALLFSVLAAVLHAGAAGARCCRGSWPGRRSTCSCW